MITSTKIRGTAWRLLFLSGVALLAAAPTAAGSTLAWTQFNDDGSRARIVAAGPDGRHLRALTSPEREVHHIDPEISPDGSQIVFERDGLDPETYEIGLVDAAGGNERIVDLGCSHPCTADLLPGWLGNDRITFTPIIGPFEGPNESAAQAVLHSAAPDGTDVERFSEPGIDGVYEDYHARFSRDGSYLVFVRVRNVDLASAIFRMNADGSDVRRLTPWGLNADLPDLSLASHGPTVDRVVFETFGMGAPPGRSQDIVTVPATCPSPKVCRSELRFVTDNGDGPVESFNPSWAPNGQRIAYVRFKAHGQDRPPTGDIWTVRPNGTGSRALSTSPRFEIRPDWGSSAPN